MAFVSYSLLAFSIVNAILCFSKKRPYRLFEHDINVVPATPSARRVRVQSTPNQSTPVRMITSAFESVSNPTAILTRSANSSDNVMDGVTENEVWEVRIWDPSPLALRLFAIFSPAHAMVYFLALPIVSIDEDVIASTISGSSDTYAASANPYKVIMQVVITVLLLSIQTTIITNMYGAKGKDDAFMKSQVMKEYDNKFVKPKLSVRKRDAATSTEGEGSVEVSPSLGNTWTVQPSPAYARHTMREEANPYFTSKRYSSTPPTATTPNLGPPMRRPNFNGDATNGRASLAGAATGPLRASMLPKRISSINSSEVQTEGRRRRSMSPVKKTPTIWGGDVDYGVPSPVRRIKRSAA